jgi:hypothetical protein
MTVIYYIVHYYEKTRLLAGTFYKQISRLLKGCGKEKIVYGNGKIHKENILKNDQKINVNSCDVFYRGTLRKNLETKQIQLASILCQSMLLL